MPSYRWSCLIAALCGVGGASSGTAASAFQYPSLSDDINTRQIHRPEAWIGGGFQSSGPINQSPAEFGPAPGMSQRSPNGNPASGDSFPLMTPGSLPGGLSPHGFNGSGMRPPVNQPPSIANNPLFGGRGQSQSGQDSTGQRSAGQSSSAQMQYGQNGPFDSIRFNSNRQIPNDPRSAGQVPPQGWNNFGPPQPIATTRMNPKVMWPLESAQQPFVGLLGQVVRPGVYEIERRGTSLSVLLKNIGGMAKDASGQFRVIRNGRPGQSIPYSGAHQFELMAGDLIIADSRSPQFGQRATNTKQPTADGVQIGFVNLIDRPVVLKLGGEHASVTQILTIMRQDLGLASQIQVVLPLGQRGNSQSTPDAMLVSETVLIFPPNSVKTERLAALPEPFKLKRETDTAAPPRDSAQPNEPRGNISPDVTQLPRSQPSTRSWSDSSPLPQVSQPVSQPDVEPAPEVPEVPPPPAEHRADSKMASGVRGSPRRTSTTPEQVARDTNMNPAPPAEGLTPSPRDLQPTDVAQDDAPVPESLDSVPFDADRRPAEPSLLNGKGRKRPIHQANDDAQNDTLLLAADLDDVEAAGKKAESSWSIWPPILTAGVGFLTLIGFSLSLRRRTQGVDQSASVPTTQPQPAQPAQSAIRNPPSVQRRDLLDAIIDDRLPLTEEQIPLASPMQFHGRPLPPKTIRMDQRHALPRPHSSNAGGVASSDLRFASSEDSGREPGTEPRTGVAASQKIRIDRSGTTRTETTIVPPTAMQTSSQSPTTGALDRALSAVQKQILQQREERNT